LRIPLPKLVVQKKTETNLIELTELYNRDKKQLLVNLTNILNYAAKKCQKDKEEFPEFFRT
jgi:hypothetical protein